eukprot:12675635-Ditylum_brightwellii.AAC.1
MMYSSKRCEFDWFSNWTQPRKLDSPGVVDGDPYDSRSMRFDKKGRIIIRSGVAIMKNSPTLLISKKQGIKGWNNVEITGYGKYITDGTIRNHSGLNMIARTNRGWMGDDGCAAPLYWAKIDRLKGMASFQKVYYHSNYAEPVRSEPISVPIPLLYDKQNPLKKPLGMKFVVYTVAQTDIRLELYIDTTNGLGGPNGGGEWILVHSFLDKPGHWNATSAVPSRCDDKNGDTFLGPKSYCALQNSGSTDTKVQWSRVSIRDISKKKSQVQPQPWH